MEIMSADNSPPLSLLDDGLERVIIINGRAVGLEFRLPDDDKWPDSISMPWVSFCMNHIMSELRLAPPPFFLNLE